MQTIFNALRGDVKHAKSVNLQQNQTNIFVWKFLIKLDLLLDKNSNLVTGDIDKNIDAINKVQLSILSIKLI